MARLQLKGSLFKFEDLWAAENWVTATIAKSNEFSDLTISSQATLENGMAIQIDGFEPLDGFWYITNYDLKNDEYVEINEFLIKNSEEFANSITTQQEVQIRIIPMLQSCKINGGNVDFGKVNVTQELFACGYEITASSKENGTLSLNFGTDFEQKTQLQVLAEYNSPKYNREFMIFLQPKNSDVAFGWAVNTTGLNLDFNENFGTTAEFTLTKNTALLAIPETV